MGGAGSTVNRAGWGGGGGWGLGNLVMQWHQVAGITAGLLVAVGAAVGKVSALAQHATVADTDVKALGSNGLHTCLVSAMEEPSLPTISQLRSSFLRHAPHLLLPGVCATVADRQLLWSMLTSNTQHMQTSMTSLWEGGGWILWGHPHCLCGSRTTQS